MERIFAFPCTLFHCLSRKRKSPSQSLCHFPMSECGNHFVDNSFNARRDVIRSACTFHTFMHDFYATNEYSKNSMKSDNSTNRCNSRRFCFLFFEDIKFHLRRTIQCRFWSSVNAEYSIKFVGVRKPSVELGIWLSHTRNHNSTGIQWSIGGSPKFEIVIKIGNLIRPPVHPLNYGEFIFYLGIHHSVKCH